MNEASRNSERTGQLIAQLNEFEAVLEREYAAIRQRDVGQIESLTQDKQSFIEDINRTAAEMGEALNDLLKKESSTVSKLVRGLIERCAKANRTNGCAIESSKSFTTTLLDILHGKVPGERTYTARGRLGANAGSNLVGHV